jgi:hypothetical protein
LKDILSVEEQISVVSDNFFLAFDDKKELELGQKEIDYESFGNYISHGRVRAEFGYMCKEANDGCKDFELSEVSYEAMSKIILTTLDKVKILMINLI